MILRIKKSTGGAYRRNDGNRGSVTNQSWEKAVKIANAVLNGEDYEKETYEETFFINRDNVEMYGTDGWQ